MDGYPGPQDYQQVPPPGAFATREIEIHPMKLLACHIREEVGPRMRFFEQGDDRHGLKVLCAELMASQPWVSAEPERDMKQYVTGELQIPKRPIDYLFHFMRKCWDVQWVHPQYEIFFKTRVINKTTNYYSVAIAPTGASEYQTEKSHPVRQLGEMPRY